jgi:hypothetical protein
LAEIEYHPGGTDFGDAVSNSGKPTLLSYDKNNGTSARQYRRLQDNRKIEQCMVFHADHRQSTNNLTKIETNENKSYPLKRRKQEK